MSKCVCVSSILKSAQDCQKQNNFLRISLDAAYQSCKTVYFCLQASFNNIHQTIFMHEVVGEQNDGKTASFYLS